MGFQIIVVGTSLGGLHALRVLLRGLPGDLQLPVAVVQHRMLLPDSDLIHTLSIDSPLEVREVEDKEAMVGGQVYLAPPEYHLLIEPGHFALSTDPPVRFSRPSIDVLFESAADTYGPGVIGVALTGASDDGAFGAACIKRRGGVVIVEDPATAESAVLPKSVIAAVKVDRVLPLADIAPYIATLCPRPSQAPR